MNPQLLSQEKILLNAKFQFPTFTKGKDVWNTKIKNMTI